MKNIAIFASGEGSNAEAIARYFANSDNVCVKCVLTNRQNAGVHSRMQNLGIQSLYFPKEVWTNGNQIVEILKQKDIDLIVLAGFLAKIELSIIQAYSNRILNIHPSLLPRYGGKGMWGHHIHEAVIANRETESGISIHFIDENIDGGEIVFQAKCEVLPDDTPDTLATRIHALEHKHYPQVIEKLLESVL